MNLPSFNIPQIIQLREKVFNALVDHIGTAPVGEEFERFVNDLYLALPEGIRHATVFESVRPLAGQELSKKTVYELAWRLAGNIAKLKQDLLVLPWSGTVPDIEWMPVQALTAVRTKTMKGEVGYVYSLRIMAGSACPLKIWKLWTWKACSYIASKLGFSPPWKAHPFRDGHELVSTRFAIKVAPSTCRDNLPGFETINCFGSLLKWNKQLLKARAHIEPPCPQGYTHFCYQCPIGYDKCQAGTHPATYTWKWCSFCNRETWHDPAVQDLCVSCRDNKKG